MGGAILTGVFTAEAFGGAGLEVGIGAQLWLQFVGAAVTSGFAVMYLYKAYPPFAWILPADAPSYPVPLVHWVKWLGNISAVLLVVGGILLWINRRKKEDKLVGSTTVFDRFFLWTVLAVIVTGVLTEAFRFVAPPVVACSVYVAHLGVVFTLFITFPYSKFAHLPYRTLALVHERLADQARQGSARCGEARYGLVLYGLVRLGMASFLFIIHVHLARCDLARFGMVRFGTVVSGRVR